LSGIGELTSLVTIIATITMAAVTVYLAYVNRKSLKEVRKERERPRIVELVSRVITPLVTKLDYEIFRIKNGNFGYKYQRGETKNITKLDEMFEFTICKQLYYDLKRMHPKLRKNIDDHDALCLSTSKKVAELYQAIHTRDFRDAVNKMVDEYGKWEGDRPPPEFAAEWSTNSFVPTAFGQARNAEFYDRNRERFERIMQRKGVLQKKGELRQVSNDLIKVATSIKEELEHIREKYRKKYDLLAEEVYEVAHPRVELH